MIRLMQRIAILVMQGLSDSREPAERVCGRERVCDGFEWFVWIGDPSVRRAADAEVTVKRPRLCVAF